MICSRCRKSFEEIIVNNKSLKTCNNCREQQKQYYQENAEKKKQYRQENVEKIKEQNKQYRQENAVKIKEHKKQYRQENVEKFKQYRQENAEKIKEQQKCNTYGCDKQRNCKKYCKSCYYKLNPDFKPKRIKIKEEELYNFLISSFPDLEIIYNSMVKGDGCCLNYRPDFLINLNKHSILVECDEFQHNYYKDTCKELTRIPYIQDILNRNLLVIRFNPDNYTDKDGKKVKSPFSIDKKIEMNTIKKSDFTNWNSRLKVLKNIIEDNLEKCPEELIKEIYLFYDGF